MATHFVIIGGGPAGTAAASHAARLGAKVALVESDIVGGTAHLRDCIPSKTMIATGGALSFARRIEGMGLNFLDAQVDLDTPCGHRVRGDPAPPPLIPTVQLLISQGVRIIRGTGRLKGPHDVLVDTEEGIEELAGDAILVCTGSRARIPD